MADPDQLYTEFYDFCRKGDAGRVKFYLRAGLRPDWVNERDRGRSLLMATAWKDSEEAARLLINHQSRPPVHHADASQMTALHICAKQNSRKVASLLLKCPETDVNAMAENGITPLMICADLTHTELGRQLLDHPGVKLDLQSSRGFTALMKAVFENSEQLALLLIERGARLDLASHSGFTALHLCAQRDRRQMAVWILDKQRHSAATAGVDLINQTTRPEYKGNTAFILAALNHHTEMLQLLKDRGANIFHRNSEGVTALDMVKRMGGAAPAELVRMMEDWHKGIFSKPDPADSLCAAILDEDADRVAKLLKLGALASALDPETGMSPVMLAAMLDKPKIVRQLLTSESATAAVNSQAAGGETPLYAAVQRGSEDCVRLLLESGALPGLATAEGANCLHLCAELNSPVDIMGPLMEKAGVADFQATNRDGLRPAEVAAVRGSVDALRLLLDHRNGGAASGGVEALERLRKHAEAAKQFRAADVIQEMMPNANDSQEVRISQLFRAAMDRNTAEVERLLDAAGNRSIINARCPREPGWTALMAAAWNDDEATCVLLLSRRADPNVSDDKLGITALHIAVQQNSLRVATRLLEQQSIDLNVKSLDMRTPLIRAAWLDHRTIGGKLLAKQADVDAQEKDGFSALHFCAQENLLEFARMLICYEANLELQTHPKKNSNTAFTLAAVRGHVVMLELLANVGANIYHRSSRGDAMELARKADPGCAKAVEALLRLDGQRNQLWATAVSGLTKAPLERASSEASEMSTDAGVLQVPNLPADARESQSILRSTIIEPIRGPEYSMTSNPRGICVIINNDEFSGTAAQRLGSNKDAEQLRLLFKDTLKFRVQMHRNLDAGDIRAVMRSLASSERHKQYDCFAAVIMSHGEGGCVFGSDGALVPLDEIYDMFRGCSSLADKPKLFFLQACRVPRTATSAAESNVDVASLLVDATARQASPAQNSRPSVDKMDFLFAYATTEGDSALRHTEEGSPYVQTLCEVVRADYSKDHLCSMLNKVRSRLGTQPFTLGVGQGDRTVYNVPSEVTQLRSEVWFKDFPMATTAQ